MGRRHERVGGCVQTRWSRKAKKKRRLLLIIARVLRFVQLGVVGCEQVGYSRESTSAEE